jgi:2-methyl-3-hydroxypyridine 5-carboxylic acid dioxygenase
MPSSLGQGAGVSIINAVALAEAVAHAQDIDIALIAWEASMRPTVEAWQRRVEDVARQRSLSRSERPLVEISAASPHRKFLDAEAETST